LLAIVCELFDVVAVRDISADNDNLRLIIEIEHKQIYFNGSHFVLNCESSKILLDCFSEDEFF
jgi:hypothetical protein